MVDGGVDVGFNVASDCNRDVNVRVVVGVHVKVTFVVFCLYWRCCLFS